MALIVDAGPFLAFADTDDRMHGRIRAFLEATNEPLFISPFVLAEVDHLILKGLDVEAEIGVLEDVASSEVVLETIDANDLSSCIDVVRRYRTLDVGLADASNVVLAHRHSTTRILTFGERHFRAMRSLSGEPFVVLPADEPEAGS